MKPKIFLRIASILMLLHDVGHTIGASTWRKTIGTTNQEVVDQMTNNKFPFMGVVRSMSEFYDGYGFACTLALLLIAIILWIASDVTEQTKDLVKKILVVMVAILLAWGIDELIFFFPFAASFTLLAMLLIIIAISNLNKVGTK